MRPIMTAKSKTTKKATKAERERFEKIAELGCILTIYRTQERGTIGQVHHLLSGRVPGRRSPHDRTIYLRHDFHQNASYSVHMLGAKGFAEFHGVSEEELLALTNELI